MRALAISLVAVGVLTLSGCADPLDDPDGVVTAALDADDLCINTSIVLRVDTGSDYWMTDDIRPDRWSGEITGTFAWSGLEGEFTAQDGTSMDYFRLGEGQFSDHGCAI